jgi:hypothetical protein
MADRESLWRSARSRSHALVGCAGNESGATRCCLLTRNPARERAMQITASHPKLGSWKGNQQPTSRHRRADPKLKLRFSRRMTMSRVALCDSR